MPCVRNYVVLRVISKKSVYIPKYALGFFYNSLVYPHVIYSIEIWGSTYHTQLGRLKMLLDKCLKILCNAQPSNSYSQLEKMNFNNVLTYFSLMRIFNYMNLGKRPYYKHKFSSNKLSTNIILDFQQILTSIIPLYTLRKFPSLFNIIHCAFGTSYPYLQKNSNRLMRLSDIRRMCIFVT